MMRTVSPVFAEFSSSCAFSRFVRRDHLAVDRMRHAALDRHDHGLLHLVAHDHARCASCASSRASVAVCADSVIRPCSSSSRAGACRLAGVSPCVFAPSPCDATRRRLGDPDHLLTQHRLEPRDVPADHAQAQRILQRLGAARNLRRKRSSSSSAIARSDVRRRTSREFP